MESLDVSIEKLGELKLKLTVTVPNEQVKEAYDKVSSSLKKEVRINGFRRGKVPRSLLEKRFEKQMTHEAIETLIPAAFDQALQQENLKRAGEPKFGDLQIDKKKPLVFSATFEVWADFDSPEYSQFKLEKQVFEVSDEERNARRLAHQENAPKFLPKEEGVVEDSDKILMNFRAKLEDDQETQDEEQEYVLGSQQYMPEIEAQFIGMSADEEKEFEITLPETHEQEALRGKKAVFHVKINQILRKELPAIDEEFLANYKGIDTVEAFDAMLDDEVRSEKEYNFRVACREALIAQLADLLTFPLPEEILNKEVAAKRSQVRQQKAQKGEEITDEELEAEAKKLAANQLRLAVYLQKMLVDEKIEVSEDEVRKRFVMNCQMMGLNPADLIQQEYGRQFYQQTQNVVFEETILDYITDKVLA